MKLSDFHYDLAPDRIAQEPISPRDHSKLLVLDRRTGAIQHQRFFEIGKFLKAGDILVRNSTRVFPARLRGKKRTGGKVEALLLNPHPAPSPQTGEGGFKEGSSLFWGEVAKTSGDSPDVWRGERSPGEGPLWRALIRGTASPTQLIFAEGLTAQMEDRLENGEWTLRFSRNSLRDYLDRFGEMPLPPYIKRPQASTLDLERYQTVYARNEGAVAAPTAGFHFTPELLSTLHDQGIVVLDIVLHVGWGTFRPVRVQEVEKHRMLPEFYSVLGETADCLNTARSQHQRIIAVGTTAVRTLESICSQEGKYTAGEGQTNLFIYPGYLFKAVDALITNFHLPDSTPLLLANAFCADKRAASLTLHPLPSRVREGPFVLRPAYDAAIREGYRFYSYGDAMFIQ